MAKWVSGVSLVLIILATQYFFGQNDVENVGGILYICICIGN